jgi:hypothetical protein
MTDHAETQAWSGPPPTDTDPDLGLCPYFARFYSVPGHNPEGICGRLPQCHDEPQCVTCEPTGGWPSWRQLREGDWTVEPP